MQRPCPSSPAFRSTRNGKVSLPPLSRTAWLRGKREGGGEGAGKGDEGAQKQKQDATSTRESRACTSTPPCSTWKNVRWIHTDGLRWHPAGPWDKGKLPVRGPGKWLLHEPVCRRDTGVGRQMIRRCWGRLWARRACVSIRTGCEGCVLLSPSSSGYLQKGHASNS